MTRTVMVGVVAWGVMATNLHSSEMPTPVLTKPPHVEYRGASFIGTVKRVDANGMDLDGIALLPIAPLQVNGVWMFLPSSELNKGAARKGMMPALCYRLCDIKVGDQIDISFDRVDSQNICNYICITRRPGGRVPPSPHPGYPEAVPYHELRNAVNDWVDKGIPMPDRMRPPWERRLPTQ